MDLADALMRALTGRLRDATQLLSQLSIRHRDQPLCHYYLFAAQCQAADLVRAKESLSRMDRADPGDPMAELLRSHYEGRPSPETTEETRLAYLAKFGRTPLLRTPYQVAVGAIFESVRESDRARVLDVGVGNGAQMVNLLDFLARRPHRVQSLDILALDFVDEFLHTAGRNIQAQARELAGRVTVSYLPFQGRIEKLSSPVLKEILRGGPLDAVNTTITLHEVPGERKVTALQNLRALDPKRLVLTEWNYYLENTLPETSVEFFFNIRRAVTTWTAALRAYYSLPEAREVVRAVLAQGSGQLTCPTAERQECYVDARTWKALLEAAGFAVEQPNPELLAYADHPERTGVGDEPWYLAVYQDHGTTPLVLLEGASA